MTVLIIDDNAPIRHFIGVVLQKRGHEILEAGSNEEANRVWEEEHQRIEAVVCDLNLGADSGKELCERFKSEKPEIHVILCSGWPEESLDGEFEFLQKPFAPDKLVAAVETNR